MERVQLCVITGQALANLIPLLQERPDHVVLVRTADKHDAAEAFARTLLEGGFTADQIHIEPQPLPPNSFEAILEYALELRESLNKRFPDVKFTWNATGGTKQMALAIWEALDRKRDRVIYTDTRAGKLEELIPHPGSTELQSLLTPTLYLHALGKIRRHAASDNAEWREAALRRRSATLHLGDHARDLISLFQQFNRIDNAQVAPQWLSFDRAHPKWRKALTLLENGGVLDLADDGRYAVACTDGARYLTGGWLEEYVWHVARAQDVDHVEVGLKFGDLALRKKGEDNEIDAFIMHCNRLLLVECKAARMGTDTARDSTIVYKLDSIGTHAGGAQATRLLVSAQPLDHETRSGHKVNTRARAAASDIHTLESDELKTLGGLIQAWKECGVWAGSPRRP